MITETLQRLTQRHPLLLAPLRASLEHERAREAEERASAALNERPDGLPQRDTSGGDMREGTHETTLMTGRSTDPSPVTVQHEESSLRQRLSSTPVTTSIQTEEGSTAKSQDFTSTMSTTQNTSSFGANKGKTNKYKTDKSN